MRKCVFLLALLVLFSGCGGGKKPKYTEEELAMIPFAQREDLPKASGGFVLAVGGETITSNEIVLPLVEHFREFAQSTDFKQFKEQARPQVEQILITRVSNILLYQQAKENMGEQIDEALEKAAAAEVRKFVASFGGDYAKAEEELKRDGMDWGSFKEYQKKMILSQSYVSSKLPASKPITYSELMDCYSRMKEEFFVIPAMLKFRLIDIEVAKLEVTDPNQSRSEQAKRLADELLGRLQAGEDFGTLAKQYSHGHRAMFGGLWKPVRPESLAKPYDILAAEAEKIEAGQIAGPIETDEPRPWQIGGGEHIFIMKLEEKQLEGYEPFEKVQRNVEEKVIFDRRSKVINGLRAKLMQQAKFGETGEFVDFCLEEIYRMSNQ